MEKLFKTFMMEVIKRSCTKLLAAIKMEQLLPYKVIRKNITCLSLQANW